MIPERQIKDRHWFSGAQVEYDFYDILSQVLEEIDSGAELHVGTDSDPKIAQILRDMYGDLNIAVHLDCSSDPSAGSSVCQKNLQSYVLGMGFRPVIKPESWAASCLADKKTKNAFTNAA